MSNTSFDKIIDNVFNSLKKLSPALVAILIASSIILFAPEEFMKKLNLDNIGDIFKTICGFSFIISLSLIVSILMFSIKRFIRGKLYIKSLKKELNQLTPSEKTIVMLMYYLPAHSISLCVSEGITGALLQKKIITYGSTVSDQVGIFTFSFILQPWVVKYLDSHPDYCPMTEDELKKQLETHYRRIKI